MSVQLDLFERQVLDWGASGWCELQGKHHNCAHAVGGPHEHGSLSADGSGVWRCSCACHVGAEPQVYAPTDKWLRAVFRGKAVAS